jgi:hypothetical protein
MVCITFYHKSIIEISLNKEWHESVPHIRKNDTLVPTIMQLTYTALSNAEHLHFCTIYQTYGKFTQGSGQKLYGRDHLST